MVPQGDPLQAGQDVLAREWVEELALLTEVAVVRAERQQAYDLHLKVGELTRPGSVFLDPGLQRVLRVVLVNQEHMLVLLRLRYGPIYIGHLIIEPLIGLFPRLLKGLLPPETLGLFHLLLHHRKSDGVG